MTAITKKLTEATVGDTTYTLVPSLAAVRVVTQACGGLIPAIDKVRGIDFDTMAVTVAAGAGLVLSTKEFDALATEIWQTEDKRPIVNSCIEFLSVLLNGGRSLPTGEEEEAEAEGNA